MISTRGPNQVLVVDRSAVPVHEVCSALIHNPDISTVVQKYPVTFDEVTECISAFCDMAGPSIYDFIEITCTKKNDVVEVETAGLSDWVFLSAVQIGMSEMPAETSVNVLYAKGVEVVMIDCLIDMYKDTEYYKYSELHTMVIESFIQAYGPIERGDLVMLLISLGVDLDDMQD